MRTSTAFATIALLMASGSLAAEAPQKPAIQTILDEAYSGDASTHAVVATIDWPVGAATGWHTHPGDEYATVLQGEIGIITKAEGKQSYRVYKAGEAYRNAKGVIHDARNAGTGPAKTVAVLIVDKGAPLSQPVR